MNWFTGAVLYVVIWWTALFAVLPFGTRPVQEPDNKSGWRGAPEKPQIFRKVIATTLITCVLWVGAYALIRSDFVSFRHGIFAEPDD